MIFAAGTTAARSHQWQTSTGIFVCVSTLVVTLPSTIAAIPLLPCEAIIDAAQQRGCDLIVMASHGRSGIAAIVLGSVTTKVLTHTKIPVLVCH